MIHVLVHHKVQDYATWKNAFESFEDTRKSFGELSFLIMHPSNEPNNLTVLFGWDNVQNAEKFMHSDELKAAMQKGGVSEEPHIQFLEEAAQGTLQRR